MCIFVQVRVLCLSYVFVFGIQQKKLISTIKQHTRHTHKKTMNTASVMIAPCMCLSLTVIVLFVVLECTLPLKYTDMFFCTGVTTNVDVVHRRNTGVLKNKYYVRYQMHYNTTTASTECIKKENMWYHTSNVETLEEALNMTLPHVQTKSFPKQWKLTLDTFCTICSLFTTVALMLVCVNARSSRFDHRPLLPQHGSSSSR